MTNVTDGESSGRRTHSRAASGVRLALAAFIAFGNAAGPAAAGPFSPAVRTPITVKAESHEVAIALEDVMVGDALQMVAREAGFRVVATVPLNERVSMPLTPRSIEEGVHRLVGAHGLLFVYGAGGRLEEVQVYGREAGEPRASGVVPEIAAKELPAAGSLANEEDLVRKVAAVVELPGGRHVELDRASI